MKLSDLLAHKGGQAVTVTATSSVADAIRAMHENDVGSVLIIGDSGGIPLGIFTERDVMRLCANGKGAELDNVPINDCMTRDVVVGSPDDHIDEIMNVMTERRFRRMPVMADGELIGLVSIGDLVRAKLEETAQEAEALRSYIAS